MALITGTALKNIIPDLIVLVGQSRRVVVFVAIDAAEHRVIAGRYMAVGAAVPLVPVPAAEDREQVVVPRKFRRHPVHVRRVAIRTAEWEVGFLVVGACRVFIILPVAGVTIGGGTGKIPARVALGAIRYIVPFLQWEKVVVDKLGRPAEAVDAVAFRAIGGKAGACVVGVGGGLVVFQVAVHAIIPDPVKFQGRCRDVALVAVQHCMNAQQREAIIVMQLGDVVHQPILGRMAAGAVRTDGNAVHVRMAGNALGRRFRKNQGLMAGAAIHGSVAPRQREVRLAMVKQQRIFSAFYFPTGRRVAIPATGLQGRAVRRLRLEEGCKAQQYYYFQLVAHCLAF